MNRFSRQQIIFICIGLLALVLLLNWYLVLFRAPHDFPIGTTVRIEEGDSLKKISDNLEQAGVVRSSVWLTNFVLLIGKEDHVTRGDYFFPAPENVYQVAKRITRGDFKLSATKITIPEGSSIFDIADILKGKFPNYKIESTEYNRVGEASGILVGGNLALIYALLGTKYSFDFQDKILFIEDIGENFYAMDRMIMSLELAGVFKKIKGLIVGGMTNMGKEGENKSYEESFDPFVNQQMADRVSKYDFPAAFNFPNGHIFDNKPLIIGSKITMKVGKDVKIKF